MAGWRFALVLLLVDLVLALPARGGSTGMPSGGGGRGGLKEKEEEKKLEFAVERGKAIDTLLHDMPYIFDSTPDFSIYRDDICLRDSAGFSASGKTPYRMFFSALRTVVPLIFHKAIVSVHIMNKYDDDQGRIRLRWKVELFREDDGDQETVEERRKREALQRLGFEVPCSGHHAPEEDKGDKLVEGISVYHLDEAGRIYRHTIESTEPTSMAEAYAKLGLIGATPASVGGRDYDMSLSGRDFDAMRGDGELEA